MKPTQLKQTFFGSSVRYGSLVLAWISLFVGVVIFLASLHQFTIVTNNFEEMYRDKYTYNNRELDQDDIDRMDRMKTERLIEAGCGILGSLFGFAISTMLLFGIYKRKPCLMCPSIIISGAGIAFLALSTFHEAFNYRGIDRDVFQAIVLGSVSYYCFLVVYSHYRELKDMRSDNILGQQILSHEQIMAKDTPIKPSDNSIA